MTGVRIGIILQALSAIITALVIAFSAGWKLSLVIICFMPIMMFSGKLQGQKQGKAGQSKSKDSFTEQAGQVINKFHLMFILYTFDVFAFVL